MNQSDKDSISQLESLIRFRLDILEKFPFESLSIRKGKINPDALEHLHNLQAMKEEYNKVIYDIKEYSPLTFKILQDEMILIDRLFKVIDNVLERVE